ncbi:MULTISPECIES: PadR family transcriptional regulator [Romboutsia]|uniref:Transcriptional regulator PadR-like family n=1 Tax=Romboutsia hominis TaxID=1507512 RepID=A0A2P2BT30_9FIRM|nr:MULTISPECIES: PadR family transcriptional regulator [Romboutsia]MCH1960775.1 PadR family transcriptional regulator [Romboutsia hominis]MCH1968791.1 PadR family transcriptional regulator [Romboutsia hominis]MDB8789897.1 PadR family transcriptional regulator [Romboutsia sp. 1001216sp1]MDB8793689.1 PadR family transcriptional regulator [Romboutsia sp. 1001216sp1]MDB8795086.1 PadR family transcriptional regulator [Romboutsia sp. 1001216sp1]
MNTQFRKGVLEICVLALISKKDMYGYEIVQNISKVIEVNEGTIYPILRRLTKEGYFDTYILESSEGPARKYYKLTDLGKENLNKLIVEWKDFVKAVNILIE